MLLGEHFLAAGDLDFVRRDGLGLVPAAEAAEGGVDPAQGSVMLKGGKAVLKCEGRA